MRAAATSFNFQDVKRRLLSSDHSLLHLQTGRLDFKSCPFKNVLCEHRGTSAYYLLLHDSKGQFVTIWHQIYLLSCCSRAFSKSVLRNSFTHEWTINCISGVRLKKATSYSLNKSIKNLIKEIYMFFQQLQNRV